MLMLPLIAMLSVQGLQAQIWDYNYPTDFDYSFHHLQLTLDFDNDPEFVNGVATWQMTGMKDGLRQIELVAAGMNIQSVRINEQKVDFESDGKKLIVEKSDSIPAHVRFKLEIAYEPSLSFGLHQPDSSLIWSSLLPGAQAFMFPSVLHPSVQVPTDIRLIVQHDWKAVANGYQLATTMLPGEKRLYHWRSEIPVAVTDIALFAGSINYVERNLSGKRVRVYVPDTSFDADFAEKLMSRAAYLIGETEKHLDARLPYEGLNILHITDHKWETRFSTATLGYLFENGGNIDDQLLRLIINQYFGAAQRTPQISKYHITLALQSHTFNKIKPTVAAHEFGAKGELREYPEIDTEPWNLLSPLYWEYAKSYRNAAFSNFVDANLSRFSRLSPKALNWDDYLELAGSNTVINAPVITEVAAEEPQKFRVYYTFDELSNRFDLELVPEAHYPSRFMPLRVRQFVNGNTTDLELLVSSGGDHIHLNATGNIRNMYIVNEDDNLVFTEIKPSEFWVYQLRNDGASQRRLEAAEGFARVPNDPDVQFILFDLIAGETDASVKAKLVSSLSELVGGAAGTHTRFIQLLREPGREVRLAAVNALANYSGNEQVQRELFRIISTSQDIPYVNAAIRAYFKVVSSQEFFSVSRSLLFEDKKDLYFTSTIIPLIVKTSSGKDFAPNLMEYLGPDYNFSLRKLTFETLKELEISPSYWHDSLEILLTDDDPRVRLMALNLASSLEPARWSEIIEDRRKNEYDVRVLQKLNEWFPER